MSSLLRSAFAPLGLASLLLTACSGAVDALPETPAPAPPAVEDTQQAPATPPDTTPSVPFSITWGECSIPGGRSGPIEAECATVDAPARRGVEGSGTTPVAVYRLKSAKQPATAQMWMLNGGPGGAGFGLAPYADLVVSMLEGIDVYLIDHRGTGESAFLDCESARFATTLEEYARDCSAEIHRNYGAAADGFSATESANDVKDLITSTAAPGQKVYVYGGSYGSYWAHRLLQLPDVRVDAVVTDGNCLGTTCSFDTPQTFGVDEAMKYILDVCKEQPSCTARLGADPWAFASETLTKVASGHCSAAAITRLAPADMMMSIGPYWPAGLLPVLYRLNRCSPADVTALDALFERIVEVNGQRRILDLPQLGPVPKPTEATSSSTALQLHVAASELISSPPPTSSALAAKAASLTFKPDPDRFDLSFYSAWKGYPKDAYVGGWVNRDVPWLMMQGTFDFQTVYSLSPKALEHVKDPSIQLVKVDGGGHGVVFASRCSLSMLQSFLADPRAKVDASCVAGVKAASLEIQPYYARYFFGQEDAWE